MGKSKFIIICPICKGEGEIFKPLGIEQENTLVKCDLCNGHRVVIRRITIKYETIDKLIEQQKQRQKSNY